MTRSGKRAYVVSWHSTARQGRGLFVVEPGEGGWLRSTYNTKAEALRACGKKNKDLKAKTG